MRLNSTHGILRCFIQLFRITMNPPIKLNFIWLSRLIGTTPNFGLRFDQHTAVTELYQKICFFTLTTSIPLPFDL